MLSSKQMGLLVILDLCVILVLSVVGWAMDAAGLGTVALQWLIAVVAMGAFGVIVIMLVRDEPRTTIAIVCANIAASAVVALITVGRYYDSAVIAAAFPALAGIGPALPIVALFVVAMVGAACVALVLFFKQAAQRSRLRKDVESVRPDLSDVESRMPGDGISAPTAFDNSSSGEDAVTSPPHLKEKLDERWPAWASAFSIALAIAIVATSIWLAFSPEVLSFGGDARESALSAVERIVSISVIVISLLSAIGLVAAVFTTFVKAFKAILRGRPDAKDGDLLAALVSLVLFLGVCVVLYYFQVRFGLEELLNNVVSGSVVPAVLWLALLLVICAMSMFVIRAVLKYASDRRLQLQEVSTKFVNVIVYYVCLLFVQILRYLFIVPDFLRFMLDGLDGEKADDAATADITAGGDRA